MNLKICISSTVLAIKKFSNHFNYCITFHL